MSKEDLPTTNQGWREMARSVFTPNVSPHPLLLQHGQGCLVYDVEGREYLDAISGIAVSALGHAHPDVTQAIADQASKLLHTSNLFLNAPAIKLAQAIQASSCVDRVFFCNSGAEANETAIKLSRRYHWTQGASSKNRIVTFTGGFHGRTYGALAATPQPKYHEGFEPMPTGFDVVNFGDEADLERVVSDNTAAILIEPIQGEGGVNLPPPGFLKKCRDIADQRGALLVFDEVQTGFGRSGRLFAYEHEDVIPDILCMAKGIAAGLPLGAVGVNERVATALPPGSHNTTYSGNPVSCRAALVVLDALLKPGFLAHIEARGRQLMDGLSGSWAEGIKEVRGRGLIVGIELKRTAGVVASEIVADCREQGLLVHVAGANVVRLAPPLIISEQEVTRLISIFMDVVSQRAS